MNRPDLEHIIRAAAEIANDDEIVVFESQAILGSFPDAPKELLVSTEADVYPRNRPDRADLIDGSIGEGSPFHEIYGYYAQGVDETTAILPRGWRERLVPVRNENTRGNTGWCLEPHDLVVLFVDALRPDRLSIAGYPRKTSPQLDALARESVWFRRAYTTAPSTRFAMASLFTGRFAFQHGAEASWNGERGNGKGRPRKSIQIASSRASAGIT